MPRPITYQKVEDNSFTFIKSTGDIQQVRFVLGWEGDVDMDASCFLENRAGKCNEDNFVFYNSPHKIRAKDKDGNPLVIPQIQRKMKPSGEIVEITKEIEVYYRCSKCQSVVHYGDALRGEGGDDEQIFVDLDGLVRTGARKDIVKILFVLTIYKKPQEEQKTFADVSNVKVTVWDETNLDNREVLRDFVIPTNTEEYEDKYSMVVGAMVYDQQSQKWDYESYEKAEQYTLPEYGARYGILQDVK